MGKARLLQVIATNMHLLGGYHEISSLAWDEQRLVLSGVYRRAPGLAGKAFLYVPAGFQPLPGASPASSSSGLTHASGRVWVQQIQFAAAEVDWSIPFARAGR